MKGKELKAQFSDEFFEEFIYDSEFRAIFKSIKNGLTPYQAIEHLCISKKQLIDALQKAIENQPRKIIVTTQRFEQLSKECTNPKQ